MSRANYDGSPRINVKVMVAMLTLSDTAAFLFDMITVNRLLKNLNFILTSNLYICETDYKQGDSSPEKNTMSEGLGLIQHKQADRSRCKVKHLETGRISCNQRRL